MTPEVAFDKNEDAGMKPLGRWKAVKTEEEERRNTLPLGPR